MAETTLGSKLIETIGLAPNHGKKPGIHYNTTKVNPVYGRGKIIHLNLNGMSLLIVDVFLKKKLTLPFIYEKNAILATYVIKGDFLVKSKALVNETLYTPFNQYLQVTQGKESQINFFKQQNIYCIQLIFNKDYTKKYNPQFLYNNSHKIFKNQITNNVIHTLLNLDSIIEKKMCYYLYVESTCVNLLSMLVESFKSVNKINSANTSYLKPVYNIKKQIDENLEHNYTVDTLCKNTGVSSFILNREFVKITGMSVSKYIKKAKMNHAKKLLEKTYLPIYDIAEKIGYKNATHFSEAFKKHFKTLPKTLRE